MDGLTKYAAVFTAMLGATTFAAFGQAAEPQRTSAAKSATAEEIATWLKHLDDSRYQVREEATQRLLAAGNVALDPLLVVANGDRPEPADRAIWILRRLSRSRDNNIALAALERLVQLEDRPAIVAKAQTDLIERSVIACEERLGPLGAEMASQIDALQATFVPILVVRLGEKWRGSAEDMRQVAQLKELRHFRLEGAPITDEVVKMFAEKEKLAYLLLFDTKVTPAAVDAVKAKHPDAMVYVRGPALLGVGAEVTKGGVLVKEVRPGTGAAAAGILQGDIIATIDGQPIPDFDRLTVRIAQHQPGDKVDIEIMRGEQRLKFQPVLGARPEGE
jgi:hypothetical protein